jgi:parallel beta-helix repeat protein
MKRMLGISALVGTILLSGTAAWAQGDFYVVAGGGLVGTKISSLPYTISTSGFYFLGKDLTATGNGITVNADNVTLDLMGFSLTGPGKASGSNLDIDINDHNNVEIRNGTVQNFGSHGLVSNTNRQQHRAINLRVANNGGTGINFYLCHSCLIKNCTVTENGNYGIWGGYENLIEGNTVYLNGGVGIATDWGGLVTGNNSSKNVSHGIHTSVGSRIMGNTCYDNEGSGINVSNSCMVQSNSAISNTGSGIVLGFSGVVLDNNASYNQAYGISAPAGDCLVDRNTGRNNTSGNNVAGCTTGLNLF